MRVSFIIQHHTSIIHTHKYYTQTHKSTHKHILHTPRYYVYIQMLGTHRQILQPNTNTMHTHKNTKHTHLLEKLIFFTFTQTSTIHKDANKLSIKIYQNIGTDLKCRQSKNLIKIFHLPSKFEEV